MSQTLATGIYILATVYGAGVTALEMLGLLGDWGEDVGAGGDGGGAGDGGAGGDGGEAPGGDAADAGGGDAHGRAGLPMQEPAAGEAGRLGRRLFAVIWYMRLSVYFSLGFGPVGLVAILVGTAPWISLLWAAPAGLLTGWMARSFFRFQQREFDSTVTDNDLVGRPAQVTISIHPGEIGKVRIQLEQLVRDRYARGESPEVSFKKGEKVEIARVTDNCVYVRPLATENEGGGETSADATEVRQETKT